MDKNKGRQKGYNPNIGFIGNAEVKVANYLFAGKRQGTAYKHARPMVRHILKKDVSSHYQNSKRLTKFLKNRDLTFSKKTSKGDQIFTVPCTTTVVPLQKSLFNEVEYAAQKLIVSCRKVLQDIYSAKDIKSSKFIKSLPQDIKEIFIHACETSPAYFRALHHPNMKDYPFMDNVGLDLVLVEDYIERTKDFPKLIRKNKVGDLPALPFRILELNAGSPSGASNNMNMLEGLYRQDPEILNSLGKVMPNDHFEVIGKTYATLGKGWTGKEGIQVIIPPGGSNGAAPEIHQLAAYSGLVYAETSQLYCDKQGHVRLRTIDNKDPIVTAAYSRVNSDSILYDEEKELWLRDPDTGENVFTTDSFRKDKDGKELTIKGPDGKPIPLESSFAIDGVIDAIVNKKFYLGGLNRILDNKIILAALTYYAPKYFEKDLIALGLSDDKGHNLLPPKTLPPVKESVDIIKENPDDWVIKSPNLAGGQGVFIMKTLPEKKKREVLSMIEKRPDDFAYQQLVKIGRIPVAVSRKDHEFRFANLAADIRMWLFYGGEKDSIPQMTHNALVRYAPQEKGKMSSIVNTSAGGGYAPFVIVDDIGTGKSVSPRELVQSKKLSKLNCALPIFVAAQLIQIEEILKGIRLSLMSKKSYKLEVFKFLESLKKQSREISAFMNPRSIELIYKSYDLVESKISKNSLKSYCDALTHLYHELPLLLVEIEDRSYYGELKGILDNFLLLEVESTKYGLSETSRNLDFVNLKQLEKFIQNVKSTISIDDKKRLQQIYQLVQNASKSYFSKETLSTQTKNKLTQYLKEFSEMVYERISERPEHKELFSNIFLEDNVGQKEYSKKTTTELSFETLFLDNTARELSEISVSSAYEFHQGKNLFDSSLVSDDLKNAYHDWKKVEKSSLKSKDPDRYIKRKRIEHFRKYPFLAEAQSIIDSQVTTKKGLLKLLQVMPYAKFNLECFAKKKGLKLESLFVNEITAEKISILNESQLLDLEIYNKDYAGECFAKKKNKFDNLSQSEVYIWLRKNMNPFTTLYTASHELIHYYQIKKMINEEKDSLSRGASARARFLNYYANFLAEGLRDGQVSKSFLFEKRKKFYGLDRIHKAKSRLVQKLMKTLDQGDEAWNDEVQRLGGLLGHCVETTSAQRVKALQEVLPAYENAKNIFFAKKIGLDVNVCEIQSALPAANKTQVELYRKLITDSLTSPKIDWEVLRVIASHQHLGIRFPRRTEGNKALTLTQRPEAVSIGSNYNQTQQ